MKKDRSNWTVRKVSFAEAEALDDDYYSSLSVIERLEMLMDLRSMIEPVSTKMEPIVIRRQLQDEEEV